MNEQPQAPAPQEDTKTQKLLKETFGALAHQALTYKRQIDSAKTQLKKDYYAKKLKKINKDALAVLRLVEASHRDTPPESSIHTEEEE